MLAPASEQRLSAPAQIAQLLARLLESRCALGLRIPGTAATYTSALLDIDFSKGTILLDELLPAPPENLIVAGTLFRVHAKVDGARVEFDCMVRSLSRGRSDAYVAAFPAFILHHERRGSFRLNVPASLGVSSTIFGAAGEAMRSRIADISRHGAGTLAHGPVRADIGNLIPCVINLPQMRIDTEAEIRTLQKSAGETRIGLLFAGLAPAQRHGINHAVAAIERLLVRHHQRATAV